MSIKKFDFSRLNSEVKPIEEGLKDVIPLDLPDEVINGDKKIIVTGAKSADDTGDVILDWRIE